MPYLRAVSILSAIAMLVLAPRPASAAIELNIVAGGIAHLVGVEHAGDGSGRLFLVSQQGRILIYDGTVRATPFLDISTSVQFGGEQGLLGLAFHPAYASNGFFYVHYINRSGDSVIARYTVSANPNVANPASASVVLTQDQPFANHNGGQLRFGPDGFLYIAFGDGGSGGDPQNNGQRLETLLGKVLRIDVDAGSPYGIPAGNPFAGTAGARPEIWSLGLRNPWRFSFDRQTGDVFIADVGQGDWEEIDVEPAGAAGRNYGWRLMEGSHCFNPSTQCEIAGLVHPIVEYPHSLGCSVTGGFRYRGAGVPAIAGMYLFADFCSGRIWGAAPAGDGSWTAVQLLDTTLSIATLGEDAAGTLYVGNYGPNGALYRIDPGAAPARLTITTSGSGSGIITSSPSAVYCGAICAVNGPPTGPAMQLTLAAAPDPGSAFAGWSGDADCADGVITLTANRQCTATFTGSFTDHVLVAGVTPVRAIHVVELRTRIDAQRRRFGLQDFAWTDTPAAGVTPVRAVHVSEMRVALEQAYVAAGRTPPVYTDPVLAAGMTVRAVHIAELRAGVTALE
jgi:glucose/arabinose dehydrogenase